MALEKRPFWRGKDRLPIILFSLAMLQFWWGVSKEPQQTIYTSIAARGGGGSFKRLKLYNSEEHLPIESFVTTLIH